MASDAPDAELLIVTGCIHCPVVLAGLAELVKQGRIGHLEVFNIGAHPEAAEARGARGVPWIRIGPFELSGAHSLGELAEWTDRAQSREGMQIYLRESLDTGQLDRVIAACRRSPVLLPPLVALAGDLDMPFAVRLGVDAVLEDLAPDGLLAGLTGEFVALAASGRAQVRADAAHFLGLDGSPEARARLRILTGDADAQVREIAAESLAGLAAPSAGAV